MGQPQQPEVRRSETTPAISPDAIESELEAERRPSNSDGHDPQPPAPGEASTDEIPDQPDSSEVAEALGITGCHRKDPGQGPGSFLDIS